MTYYGTPFDAIVSFLRILPGDNDDELHWPVKVKVEVEQLNQAADQDHVMATTTLWWDKEERERWKAIDDYYAKYDILEKREHGMQYMMNVVSNTYNTLCSIKMNYHTLSSYEVTSMQSSA